MPKAKKSVQAKQRSVTPDDMMISDNLCQLMNQHGWNPQGMASGLKISVGQMRKYMSGSNRISAGRLAKIADLMGLDIALFYGKEPADAE